MPTSARPMLRVKAFTGANLGRVHLRHDHPPEAVDLERGVGRQDLLAAVVGADDRPGPACNARVTGAVLTSCRSTEPLTATWRAAVDGAVPAATTSRWYCFGCSSSCRG